MQQNPQFWMPYFANTMAIVIAIFVAAWLHNKHIDTLNHRIDDTNRRIEEFRAEIMPVLLDIQKMLRDLDRRVTRIEERSAIVHS